MGFFDSEKAIATHTIVIVIMMGFFAIVGVFLFYKWSDTADIQATAASCTFKRIAFCTDWNANGYKGKPWDWNDKNPLGCEKFDITEPTTPDDCQIG